MAQRKRRSKTEQGAAPAPDKPKIADSAASTSVPSVRVYVDWTPQRILAAERMAESGDLSLATALCNWILRDDRVVGALNARVSGLLGLPPDFEAGGDKRRSKRVVKALEADEDWDEAYPESTLALMLKWGILLGVAPAMHGWQERADHGGRRLPMPQFWHTQTLRRDYITGQWSIRDRNNVLLPIVPGEGTWILHQPFGDQRPWAYGLWRSLALWVLLKHFARSDSGAAGEKASTGVVTTPKGSTYEQRKELAQAIINSGADRQVVLPAEWDMKLLELSAATAQLYEKQVAMANAAIAICIRGGNLSTEVQDGSRAAAEVQERTGDRSNLRFDAETLSTTLNKQSLSWWAQYNFGDKALAPWPSWPTEPEEDKSARATTVNTLASALKTLKNDLGYEIDDKKLVEGFGLDFLKERTENTPPPVKPQPPGPPQAKTKGDQQPQDGQPVGGDGKAAARGPFAVALASGDKVSEHPGFLAGQLYTDGVVESAVAASEQALEPTLQALAAEIEAARGFADLRERLHKLYPKLSAVDLGELCFRSMMLAELAGRRAVTQDG